MGSVSTNISNMFELGLHIWLGDRHHHFAARREGNFKNTSKSSLHIFQNNTNFVSSDNKRGLWRVTSWGPLGLTSFRIFFKFELLFEGMELRVSLTLSFFTNTSLFRSLVLLPFSLLLLDIFLVLFEEALLLHFKLLVKLFFILLIL